MMKKKIISSYIKCDFDKLDEFIVALRNNGVIASVEKAEYQLVGDGDEQSDVYRIIVKGQSLVDLLRMKVDVDKKCMHILYDILEEAKASMILNYVYTEGDRTFMEHAHVENWIMSLHGKMDITNVIVNGIFEG